MIGAITWNVHPEIFPDTLPIRWYGLLFASAFLVGYEVLKRIFKHENKPEEWTDKALIYVMIGTILGARLGHVFFYDWGYYQNHLIEIPMIWKGGLASHGAAIGNILALIYFSKKVTKLTPLYILDRVVVTMAIGATFVRLGNLMNSEIIGKPTGSDFGFIFKRIDGVARHPAQLYEAVCYLFIFILLRHLYYKLNWGNYAGRLFGVFLAAVFFARFVIEFFKENQVAFESELPLNMGQLLSIPLVLAGVAFILLAKPLNTTENVKQN
ncbi:prolipoprotein diacylglyceryl transferase [Luteibaculum oceani]|uniref:Phosphatidylglycerol--prolipoprotein diacylglyceryl transferase n=1 Tax=Luteibaculum oceani TaxID=1294296 RepID=A0A5C6V211_9FLAO|nr:prolipoprotein diacylglyceryl transferase [Luteibaculum oceani]TXC78466.1 prolipoprotein diacylglyceryl transferase [Luteibaculum oceani]